MVLVRGLAAYSPRSLGLFAAAPLPWRGWLPAVGLGAATFPAIEWLHGQVVQLLSTPEAVR